MRYITLIVLVTFFALDLFVAGSQEGEQESFETCDQRVSFEYPGEMFIEEVALPFVLFDGTTKRTVMTSVIKLASEEALLYETLANIDGKSGLITIHIRPSITSISVENLISSYIAASDDIYSELEALNIGDYLFTTTSFTRGQFAPRPFGLIAATSLDSTYILWIDVEASSENVLSELSDILVHLLETLDYDSDAISAGRAVYFEDNCRFRFSYPDDWLIENLPYRIVLTNSHDTLTNIIRRQSLTGDLVAIQLFQHEEIGSYLNIEMDTTSVEDVLYAYLSQRMIPLIEEPRNYQINELEVLEVKSGGQIVLVFERDDTYLIVDADAGSDFEDFPDFVEDFAGSLTFKVVTK